jgi:hypothetical protein
MSLDILSLSIFWTWYAFQPATVALPQVRVLPTKQIIQATWVEPAYLRDDKKSPVLREPAMPRQVSRLLTKSPVKVQKLRKPLWKAAPTWEFPPILWAGFEGFLAAGLGIVSLLKR